MLRASHFAPGRWPDDHSSHVGGVVAITTTDSEPLLLVSSTTDDDVTGVLLADLATETRHRLEATEPDTATRQELAAAIAQAATSCRSLFRRQTVRWWSAIAAILGRSREGSTDGRGRQNSGD